MIYRQKVSVEINIIKVSIKIKAGEFFFKKGSGSPKAVNRFKLTISIK